MSMNFNYNPINITNKLIEQLDETIKEINAKEPERKYLGASSLGNECQRKTAIEYRRSIKQNNFDGKTLRIFKMGHVIEDVMSRWLIESGAQLETVREDNEQFGFSAFDGKFKGHCDGVFTSFDAIGLECPALWECKSMNEDAMKDISSKGLKNSKPVYYSQMTLYMGLIDYNGSKLNKNPGVFTAYNKNGTQNLGDKGVKFRDVYCELIPFDEAEFKRMLSLAENILNAKFPLSEFYRISNDQNYYACKWCNVRNECQNPNAYNLVDKSTDIDIIKKIIDMEFDF